MGSDVIGMDAGGAMAKVALFVGGGQETACARRSHDVLRLPGTQDWIAKLPEIGSSDDIVGGISVQAAQQAGLLAGAPVVRGAVDKCASAFGIPTQLHVDARRRDTVPVPRFPCRRGVSRRFRPALDLGAVHPAQYPRETTTRDATALGAAAVPPGTAKASAPEVIHA
ncbi:hypothetical protein [Salipiger aestuarii]|uniref:hypothetical protein n=1 Tax=Salipiger aestuarii TaxID=568098 RepID=UPI00123A7EBF|nr:hypothetical protein [Salipiger aestuarii]KAA8611411.1 hypothetical protein AL037_09525 [Salipiger aestuarii]